jgi:MFS family permease
MNQARSWPGLTHRTRSVVAVIGGSFLVRLGGAATGVMLGFLLSHLHRTGAANTSAAVVGFLAGAFYVSELVGSPIAGFLIDRRGLRSLLLAGPILGILASAIVAGPAHLLMLTIARLLQGLTTACTIPAALAFLSDETRDGLQERGRTMGFFEVGSIGGLAVGLVLGGRLWSLFGREGFWWLATLYGIAVALFVFIRSESTSRVSRPLSATIPAIWHASDLMPSWLAANAAAGLWFAHAAYQLSGARPLEGQLLTAGMPEQTIGLVFGGYALLFTAGTIGWGLSINRISLTSALRVGTIGLLAGGVAIYGINHAQHFSVRALAVWGLVGIVGVAAQTAFTPAALTLLAARSDHSVAGRGAVMGVYSTLLAGGQLIGAVSGGLLAMQWGVDGLILGTAIFGVIGFLTLPRGTGPAFRYVGKTAPTPSQIPSGAID